MAWRAMSLLGLGCLVLSVILGVVRTTRGLAIVAVGIGGLALLLAALLWWRAKHKAQAAQWEAALATAGAEEHQRRKHLAAWLAALPVDVQADLAPLPPFEQRFLMDTAALTPASDAANAIRRWRTMPDEPPRRAPDMSLAVFVDHLFATQLRPDGTSYTEADIAAAFEGQVDPGAVRQLRTGATEDLDLDLIFKVGRFFHVPPEYIFPVIHIRWSGGVLDPGNRRTAEDLLRKLLTGVFAQRVWDTERVNGKM